MLKPLYGDVSHRFRVLRRVRSDLRALGASRTLIDAMRGRVTGKVCSMVCGYDKVKVRSDREARRLEHVCFESGGRDARSDPNRTSRPL